MWGLFGGLYLAVSLATAAAAAPPDPTRGGKLAHQWCAACHVVAANQSGVVAEAPPFATVAQRPDFDQAKLARFLLNPHPKMPNMSLTRTEAADIAAYIATLK
jgi:mono/diheme cytochrome c family protein